MSAEHGPWIAVVNWGRWIVECPRPRCNYAYEVVPGQPSRTCQTKDGQGCGYTAPVQWPADAAGFTVALADRPTEQDRNWAPAGHPQTYRSMTSDGRLVAEAFPEGQTLADIRAENHELEAMPAKRMGKEELVVKANDALAALGFRFDPDTERLRRL